MGCAGPGIGGKETCMKLRIFVPVFFAAGIMLANGALTAATSAPAPDPEKPYTVKDGKKVDMSTYKGYLYYGDLCMRCHGPDGLGSSYAPNLTNSLKSMNKEQVENTVINGRKNVNSANDRVMPSFGTNEDAVANLDNIYSYLKARSDGVLGRGHPDHIDQ
jgi:mono/diheme cytochrome c family protein